MKDFTEAAQNYAASIGNIDGTAAFDFKAGAEYGYNEAMKERDEFAKRFLEYASGLAISNFKSGGTWYLENGTFCSTDWILDEFKALNPPKQ